LRGGEEGQRSTSKDWVRTAIVLAFYVGLRSGELRDRPKGNDERIIPIAELALAELQKAVQWFNPENLLVTNRNGRTPSGQGVWLAFRAVQDKAGLDRRFGVRAAPRLLHGARAQRRERRDSERRDGEGARGSRGPTHHSALPALRAHGRALACRTGNLAIESFRGVALPCAAGGRRKYHRIPSATLTVDEPTPL
jgi:hypothetical protein